MRWTKGLKSSEGSNPCPQLPLLTLLVLLSVKTASLWEALRIRRLAPRFSRDERRATEHLQVVQHSEGQLVWGRPWFKNGTIWHGCTHFSLF